MPPLGLVSEVHAVDWLSLKSTYGSGEVVRDIVLGLASSDEAEVRRAWERISATHLQHQGTVYPATAAAAPFMCRIALDEGSKWRAALIKDVSYLSTGYDKPYSPAGTAQAVRDAVRPYVDQLLGLWGTDDQELDLALVTLSVAFPVEAAAVVSRLRSWFGRSEPPVRRALGLALGFHGSADHAVRRIVEEEVSQSITWVVRGGGFVTWGAGSEEKEEPYIYSSILDAIHLARRLQAGVEEHTVRFSQISVFLGELMDSGTGSLIKWPG